MTDLVRRWFGVATSGLHWSPADFWLATVAEFLMAIEGHNESQRTGPPPMTHAELMELDQRYGKHG